MEVGIRELKARLSLYVGEAADGATIVSLLSQLMQQTISQMYYEPATRK